MIAAAGASIISTSDCAGLGKVSLSGGVLLGMSVSDLLFAIRPRNEIADPRGFDMTLRMPTVPPGLRGLLGMGVIAGAVAGCGGSSDSRSTQAAAARPAATYPTPARAATARPARRKSRSGSSRALPAGWRRLRMPSGGELPYPPGWRSVSGDSGSVSAALTGPDGLIRGYLNATPAEPDETPAGWSHFRISHNADDGDHDIHVISVRRDVRLGRGGRASCVADRYATSRTSYRELACLLMPADRGPRTVLVAATQPGAWAADKPLLNFAFAHFTS